jgi:hypothetical protein
METLLKRQMFTKRNEHEERVREILGETIVMDMPLLTACSLLILNVEKDIREMCKFSAESRKGTFVRSSISEADMAKYLVKIIPQHCGELVEEIRKKMQPKNLASFLHTVKASIHVIYLKVSKRRKSTLKAKYPEEEPSEEETSENEASVDLNTSSDEQESSDAFSEDTRNTQSPKVARASNLRAQQKVTPKKRASNATGPPKPTPTKVTGPLKPTPTKMTSLGKSNRKRNHTDEDDGTTKRHNTGASQGTPSREKAKLPITGTPILTGSETDVKFLVSGEYIFVSVDSQITINSENLLQAYTSWRKIYGNFDCFINQEPHGLYLYDTNMFLITEDPISASKVVEYLESKRTALEQLSKEISLH